MPATFSWSGGGTQSAAGPDPAGALRGFRERLYGCLTRRGDALFEVADAVLCAAGPVTDLARLSLVPECRRGYGGLSDGLNAGRVEIGRLRRAVAGLELPAWPDGGIRLAVDVCGWLRPDAATSAQRLFCHVHGRGTGTGQVVAGWPYSFVTALAPGPSSWTGLLDAVRLGPDDADDCATTAAQLREVAGRLIAAGHWRPGDPPILVTGDAGYNPARLAFLLADLPVIVVARVRSDRVWYRRAPARRARAAGRPQRHGLPVRSADPATWDDPGGACLIRCVSGGL